ncbi:MAG: hypothetical protein ABOK23_04230 [Candidatus Methanoperedens sp.]|nr:hypothetical protein [Candidatus Methanoperedens sp.]MCZ7396878.1 hypothetical protein [Candidatus Methanoperedens sp.]
MGKLTMFLIVTVAASVFALPTVTSVDRGQYTSLTIVIMLTAIIAMLISAIRQKIG